MGCFSPLVLEKMGSKPGHGHGHGHVYVHVFSFLVWKNRFIQGKIAQIFCFVQGMNTFEILRINPIQN